MQSLLEGQYDGDQTLGALKNRGDFGVGMINALDGEIVALDGQFYRVGISGHVSIVSSRQRTPFAVVTFFEPDNSMSFDQGPIKFADLRNLLSPMITDKNIFYAVKIGGEFQSVTVRHLPAQKRPYRPLLDVVKTDQRTENFTNVKGTMVGFWFPVYSGGLSIPQYHFHFLGEQRRRGGHVLNFSLLKGTIEMDATPNIQIVLLLK